MGCYEVSLGDRVGVGVPLSVERLIQFLKRSGIAVHKLAGHFHDTYGQAIANVWAAYQCGVCVFDSSVGGLGGCPFAPGAKGNVGTEDVVCMCQRAGVYTGVNLPELASVGDWISGEVGKHNDSRVGKVLAFKQQRDTSFLHAVKTRALPLVKAAWIP